MKSDQMARGTLDAGPQKGGVRPRPFSGWALEAAQELEWQSAIPLVSRLFAASDLRRGAAFLALSAWYAPGRAQRICLAGMGSSEFVTWLLEEDPSEIAEVLDSRRRDPQGLARLGREPLLRPEQYRNPFL
ncbi:hypothetical protein ORIO_20645 (plasmid) [Cereibacter azotoformans]|uniref:hypothetical protein n=1 Tax=Cereibacter azotoformans TaxID=43057 RepID=UPI001EEB1A06|nr:hypothetical protein [Cereibacter azotoformans]ULB12210.1 hypothetical protein ORIO_20645 [Cereibacter azotoformans]